MCKCSCMLTSNTTSSMCPFLYHPPLQHTQASYRVDWRNTSFAPGARIPYNGSVVLDYEVLRSSDTECDLQLAERCLVGSTVYTKAAVVNTTQVNVYNTPGGYYSLLNNATQLVCVLCIMGVGIMIHYFKSIAFITTSILKTYLAPPTAAPEWCGMGKQHPGCQRVPHATRSNPPPNILF